MSSSNHPHFMILGFLLGICNYIPYIGSIVATVIAVAVVWFTQGFTMAVIATIVIFILQQIGAYIIHPMLMGKSFKFSPLLVLISVVAGGAVFGVFGMIIAIPVAVIVKDMIADITRYIERRKTDVYYDGIIESGEIEKSEEV